MSTPTLGIIADDLTGACDTAAQLTTSGLPSLCLISLEEIFAYIGDYYAISINTQSRCMERSAAAEAVSKAMKTLINIGPRFFFKKIDTALRGNIADETLAAMDYGFNTAILVAAIPQIGRTTRGGRQFIWGYPLEETHIAKDTLNKTPFITSYIPELFRGYPGVRTETVPIQTLAKSGATIPRPSSSISEKLILVFDAETQEDIECIVRTALRETIKYNRQFLYIGSLGLMKALVNSLKKDTASQNATAPILPWPPRKILVACGSPHPVAQLQIERLLSAKESRNLPLHIKDLEHGLQFPTINEGNILCMHILPEFQEAATTIDIPNQFAKLVIEAINLGKYDCLIVFGGETAYAICQQLSIKGLEIISVFDTVMAIAKPKGSIQLPCSIITKGGSVGSISILVSFFNNIINNKG
jgi:uncharacterized protein YgbK (DUF1537 family)